MSEHTGPYKSGTNSDGNFGVYDERDGSFFSRNSWDSPDATAAAAMLNLAFHSGQRSADAGLREALEKIANLITAPRGRTVAMTVAMKEIARAALAKAKEGT